MAKICVFIVIFILNVFASDKFDFEDEIDPVVEMLLNSEYEVANESIENKGDVKNEEGGIPAYIDGVWQCGNCTNLAELKLLYSENYDLEYTYDMYTEIINMETQIGLSLKGMRCVTVQADEDGEVSRVSGSCFGEQVTLGVMNVFHCIVSVYG